jgi:hypothetical protein
MGLLENGILLILPFHNDLWNNILGGPPVIVVSSSDFKKELLELSQV